MTNRQSPSEAKPLFRPSDELAYLATLVVVAAFAIYAALTGLLSWWRS